MFFLYKIILAVSWFSHKFSEFIIVLYLLIEYFFLILFFNIKFTVIYKLIKLIKLY
jgi:hypothetical protein